MCTHICIHMCVHMFLLKMCKKVCTDVQQLLKKKARVCRHVPRDVWCAAVRADTGIGLCIELSQRVNAMSHAYTQFRIHAFAHGCAHGWTSWVVQVNVVFV